MKIIFRVLGLPFFAVFIGIAFVRQWLTYCFDFLKYGGEGIAYTGEHNAKTIMSVYDLMVEKEVKNE